VTWKILFAISVEKHLLAILNTENMKICGSITKLEGIKMQSVCVFFDIRSKFEFLLS